MINLSENFFSYVKMFNEEQNNALTYECDFCLKNELKYSDTLDYCPKCSTLLCMNCKDEYMQTDLKLMEYTVTDPLKQLKSKQDFTAETKKGSFFSVFSFDNSSASILAVDYVAYLNSFFKKRL